jgi:two-component system sensor histidine kinase HydH
MAGSLAHEIGSPLNAISGHLEFIGDIQSNDSELRRRIRIIRQQLDFIVGTVRRLLEWTHKRKLVCAPTDVVGLIKEVLLLVGPALVKHSITVSLDSSKDVPILEVDSERLQHVFLNLLNNSIEAMPHGGTIDITVRLTKSGRMEILFQDSGVGIEPATAERLFEPMWTTKPSGSGFGLAIARETMNEHGGDIHVLQNVTKGACFVLTIPLVRTAEIVEAEATISNVA